MITLRINEKSLSVSSGTTLLKAAGAAGFDIPTLCYLDGCETFTSCMLCVIEEKKSGRLLPACTARVAEGMDIETDNTRVRQARKDTLDMLLSEHVGDCEAPCRRTCPANMDIPHMIRQIQAGELAEALQTVKKDIALPAILGRICPAPCEAGCNRKAHDQAVSICLLKRYVADVDLAKKSPFQPEVNPATGKRVAVVGAGPAGLSAVYYLIQQGHAVTLFDKNPAAGGQLWDKIEVDRLPKSVLEAEINLILNLGVDFQPDKSLGRDIFVESLRQSFDAVVLTFGVLANVDLTGSGLDLTSKGLVVNRTTYETSLPSVFAGGNTIGEGKRAIRSLAHGKSIACSVDQFLNGLPVTGEASRFDSRMGKLIGNESVEFLKDTDGRPRLEIEDHLGDGFFSDEARRESERCFHCDCRKPDTCRLRHFSESYGADQGRYKTGMRKAFERVAQHEIVLYEPGKCIKCGLCIQITEQEGETLGFTFVGRGFDVKVAVPFDETVEAALKKAARACIHACPTGALAYKGKKG